MHAFFVILYHDTGELFMKKVCIQMNILLKLEFFLSFQVFIGGETVKATECGCGCVIRVYMYKCHHVAAAFLYG